MKENRFCDFSVFRGSFYSVFSDYIGVSQPKYRIIRILSVMGFILYNVEVREQRGVALTVPLDRLVGSVNKSIILRSFPIDSSRSYPNPSKNN